MAAQAERGVPLSTLCPKYLHTNSTSHTWPFGAIAELIDNAYDPDVSAKQFWIDKTVVKGQDCLTFMDNGNGLDHEAMHKMLSFGYSDKVEVKGQKPVGMYGNGFKSGAMRLGKDAIVFSKSKSASCIGMLSQTYLKDIGAEQIIVPIVCFEQREANNFSVREEHKASLHEILSHSPFNTEAELFCEINAITSPCSTGKTGTRIIIWNLRSTSTKTTEFDFETDRYDIRTPLDGYQEMIDTTQPAGIMPHIPESTYSLRAYCSILYLKPRMQIIIRGQKVKTQLISKSLAHIRKDSYHPTFLQKPIPITFGYVTKNKAHYGIMMYHKNRLIKAYERMACQNRAKGVGVIGIIECDFLEPTHNKQSFNETDKYRKTIINLGKKLEDYWKEMHHNRNKQDPNYNIPVEDTEKRPDQNWAQCDDCLKWRKLPDGIDCDKLPAKWYCRMNPDPQFRTCQIDEERQDSDDEQPTYQKTFKIKERQDKKNEERKRQQEEEDRKRQEEQRLAEFARETRILKRKQAALDRQLQQTNTVSAPSTPTTPRSRLNTGSPQGGSATAKSSLLRSTMQQAACSPSSNNGLPVIANVCSLSDPQRGKRAQPVTPQITPKRLRVNAPVNGFHQDTSETSLPVDMSPLSSPAVPADDNDEGDDTDDEIFIVETASTPKPQTIDLNKVKTEQEQSGTNVGMLLESSGDTTPDVASESSVAGMGSAASAAVETSPSTAPPTGVTNSTTQTELPKVKEEKLDQDPIEVRERAVQSVKEEMSEKDINVSVEERVIKHERSEDSQGENQAECTLQNRETHHLDIQVSPLHQPSMIEVQEQQDQLLDLLQATAQERDAYKEQVRELTCQVQDMQSRLQELSQINVMKECSHQDHQTKEMQDGYDYKGLFEKSKQKIDELIKDKEALLAATETKPRPGQGEERTIDEIALEADRLLRELDETNKEREELRSQLDNVEKEKANLASKCEELRLSLQQLREDARRGSTPSDRTTELSAQIDPEEAGGTNSSSDTFRCLVELRHNIGRLLISHVPALDLTQVNYECNVIDEILEQVVSGRSGDYYTNEAEEQ